MDSRIHISPSLLAADTACLAVAVDAVEKAGARSLHIDVMDGHYVANLAFSPKTVVDLRRITHLPLHVHLEVANPAACVPLFTQAELIIVQEDTAPDLGALLALIRSCGCRVGAAVNPDRPVEALADVLPDLDLLLVMAVWPGFGGQPFDARVLAKVAWARMERKRRNLHFVIALDGGVGPGTISMAAEVGVDVYIAGSSIFVAAGAAPATSAEIAHNVRRLADLAAEHLP